MILLGVGGHLAKAGNPSRKHVDIVHTEIDFGFMGNGQQVQHGICRTTHGNIQRHGVQESFPGSYAAGKYTVITFFIILISIFHDQGGSITEQLLTVGMSRHDGSVARKCQSDCFIQTVHRIGGKHSRTASASRTRVTLDFRHVFIADCRIGRLDHRINQIQLFPLPLAGFHRTAGNKYGGDIQTHGYHQHTRSNLVAVGNAHHRICLVGIDHIFNAVGNDVTRRQ